ncbi:MAG TPA: aspartate aminotransferase family protein, partial [Gammaproteobacteria bacterium]|nr:aspartate aminotransferase family protein [Gammaproteobacteria bacterium]
RQLGLMIGIELRQKATPFLQALLEHRIIALPAGPTVIRLLPPLTIAQSDLDRVVSTLQKVL